MTKWNKRKLPFDGRGGVLVIQRRLIASDAYANLTPAAKVLALLMQAHWKNDKPVAYGVREAMVKVPCAKGTAQKAFNQLEEAGFIHLVDHSMFSSRIQSKTRTWRLTWMPFMDKAPTHEWEKNEFTRSKIQPAGALSGHKCALVYASPGPTGSKMTTH